MAATSQEAVTDIRSFLDNHAGIQDIDPQSKLHQNLNTRLEKYAGGKLILIYYRDVYTENDTSKPHSNQMITYTFSPEQLNPTTLNVISFQGDNSGDSLWMVAMDIKDEIEFIPYKNIEENTQFCHSLSTIIY